MRCKNPFMFGVIPCPCGQCRPCRINRRRVWTHRIMLEAKLHTSCGFLTLTYDDEHLPSDLSLDPRHTQLFLKRLRKELPVGSLRFFLVGEYGTSGERGINPHYHCAIFGLGCRGRRFLPETGSRCYCVSCELVRLVWGKGNITLDPLERKSAQYIAGYVVKKLSRSLYTAQGLYPEFQRSSNRPGIGAGVVDGFLPTLFNSETGEIYLSDTGDVPQVMILDGMKWPLGRYLLNRFRKGIGVTEVSKESYVKELQDMWLSAWHGTESPPLSVKQMLLDKFAGDVAVVEAAYDLYLQKGKL